MKKWSVRTNDGATVEVRADSASITPSGALTFYVDNSLDLAFSPDVWDSLVAMS